MTRIKAYEGGGKAYVQTLEAQVLICTEKFNCQANLNFCINRQKQFGLLLGKPSYQKVSPGKLEAPRWKEGIV